MQKILLRLKNSWPEMQVKSEEILLEQLENLPLKKEEHENELEFCENEKKRLPNKKLLIRNRTRKSDDWKNGDPDKREDYIKTLVRRVFLQCR